MDTAPKQSAPLDEAAGLAAKEPTTDARTAGTATPPSSTRLSPDRRRYHRVDIRLLGRFMRADRREYPCQILNMSPGDAALLAPVDAEIGERLVVYIDHIGRIEGDVARGFEGGFAVSIQASRYKREKLASQLTWLINRDKLDLAEDRRFERLVPKNPFTKLALADGTEQNCRVLDVSLSGASVAIDPKPPIGAEATLGLMRSRVVRHHDHGIGIQFLDVQDLAAIKRHFG